MDGRYTLDVRVIFLVAILFVQVPPALSSGEGVAPSAKIGPMLQHLLKERAGEREIRGMQALPAPKAESQLHKVIVVLDAPADMPADRQLLQELDSLVRSLGGRVGTSAWNNVQVWIPWDQIEALGRWEKVGLLREPICPQLQSVETEALDTLFAKPMQHLGMTGRGSVR